jgi:transposase
VNGKLMWLHVACTDELTFYFMHGKRGQIAMDEMNILPEFKGTSIHDGLASYQGYDCEHGLCNAHHLRELLFVVERYEQPWAEQMMTLLTEIKAQIEVAKLDAKTAFSTDQKTAFEVRYADLIDEGLKANPPPVIDENAPKRKGRPKQSPPKNLLDRLDVHRRAVLAFMYDFRVPFDNNQAERDLRMMKLKQKISGGFRSFEGGRMFCRIRGYISTLRKKGFNVLDSLRQVFRKNPPFSDFQTE